MHSDNEGKRRAKIIGTGSFVPPNKYSTADMKRYFPSIDVEENLKTIGVKNRYFVRDYDTDKISHTNSELTCESARLAMKDAGISVEDLDLIITTTASPDYSIPNMACMIQDQLGAKNIPAIGLLSGCGGFIYALTMAVQFIENGFSNMALVTGSEVLSPYLDFSHPKCIEGQAINSTIFGDGSGAVIVKSVSREESGIICNYLACNGKRNPLFLYDSGSKNRPNKKTIDEGLHFWDLNLRLIAALTPKYMKEALDEILKISGHKISDIDWIVPHQPTMPLVQRFAEKIGYPMEKLCLDFEEIGDTADACLAMSLDRANRAGKLKKDDLVMLVSAGAGWMYGANLIRW